MKHHVLISVSSSPSAYYHYYYTVSRKNIPNINDCHSKKSFPILIIVGTNISGTTGHRMTGHLPLRPMSASAVHRENWTNKIWVTRNILDCDQSNVLLACIIFSCIF